MSTDPEVTPAQRDERRELWIAVALVLLIAVPVVLEGLRPPRRRRR
jgi:hypothetical protein